MEVDRPHGRVEQGGSARNGGGRQEEEKLEREVVPTVVLDPAKARGVKVASETGKQRPKWNVGTVAKRATGRASSGRSAPNRTNPNLNPAEPNREIESAHTTPMGRKDPKPKKGPTFVMKHMVNSMKNTTSESDVVGYVDSGASNHMTSHEEWFSNLEKSEQPGVVETGDDTSHPIEHV